MNLLVIHENKYIPVIDGVDQVKIEADTPQELYESLICFECKFKILGYDGSYEKRKVYEMFCMSMMSTQYRELFYDGYISVLEKAKKANIKDFSLAGIKEHFKIEYCDTIYLIDVCNSMLDEIIPKDSELIQESMTHIQKINKYMNPKYVQINSNGDIYISSIASKNTQILSFICEELINRFS